MKHVSFCKGIAAALMVSLLALCAACGGAPKETQSGQTTAPTEAPTQSATAAPTEAPTRSATEAPTEAPKDAQGTTAGEGQGASGTSAEPGYDLAEIKSKLTEAYMGVTEAGEGAYFASNDDGSFVIVAFYDPETNESASFVGPGTTTADGLAQVTDVESNLTLSFSAEAQEGGALLIDMGDLGQALIEPCTVDEVLDALQKITAGSNPIL